ncbi:MAG: type II toxin-antitoxin system TacA family antitoxin [Blastocatellia bacterium]
MPLIEAKTNEVARLNFRLPKDIKNRVENAALVSGITVTDFAISALANSADEVLQQQQSRTLTNRDRDLFLAMLENPPEPNEALRKAVRNYKKHIKK